MLFYDVVFVEKNSCFLCVFFVRKRTSFYVSHSPQKLYKEREEEKRPRREKNIRTGTQRRNSFSYSIERERDVVVFR